MKHLGFASKTQNFSCDIDIKKDDDSKDKEYDSNRNESPPVDVLEEGDSEEMQDMIDIPSFSPMIEDQVVVSPISEVVILSEAEINKLTIIRIKEYLNKRGIVLKSTSNQTDFSKLLQESMEIRDTYVANNIGRDGNTPGDGLHLTSYWDFK